MAFDLTRFPEETDMNHCEYYSLMNMPFQNKLTKRWIREILYRSNISL